MPSEYIWIVLGALGGLLAGVVGVFTFGHVILSSFINMYTDRMLLKLTEKLDERYPSIKLFDAQVKRIDNVEKRLVGHLDGKAAHST